MPSAATPRDVLTPDALAMLQRIADTGSFAAAARALGLVPSALTYRVRHIEDALDVLLFDRSSRQARLTEAGDALLAEGSRLLQEIDAMANRVRRVATGWETELTIAVDGLISRDTMMDLVEAFYAQLPPTRLRLRDEILLGTLEALSSGQADLAIGVSVDVSTIGGLQLRPIGTVDFVYAVAPHHPLAATEEPLRDDVLRHHRAIAVADSVQRGHGVTLGLLPGQDVLTVPTLQAKILAQLRGLGGGFLPEPMVRPYAAAGRLVVKAVDRPPRIPRAHYAWRGYSTTKPGQALQWWLTQLERPATRAALLDNHGSPWP